MEALSLERSADGGWITFFIFGNVTVKVGAGSPKLKYEFNYNHNNYLIISMI